MSDERVDPRWKCPGCGEDRMDYLNWIDDDVVECATCGAYYDPNEER